MKKKTFILIASAICLLQTANCFSQGSWTQKADFGGTARYSASSFSIGTKGYIGTGNDGTYRKDFWEYDLTSNAWTQKADFGGTARGGATGFSIGTKGYIGMGTNGAGFSQDFWEWNQSTNTWTQKLNFGGTTRYGSSGFSIGTKGYIGTGYDGAYKQDFWEWDQTSNSWTQKNSFSGIARNNAVGFSIGNNGYIGTGKGASNTKDFWEWNQSTNSWTQKANFGGVVRGEAVGFSIAGRGYIGTGTAGGSSRYQDFWEYEPVSNTWIQKAIFGGTARSGAVGFSIGNKGYIGTGDDAGFTQDFWEWNPCTNISTTVTASPDTCTTNGAANVSASGGSSPYSYLWSTNATTSAIAGLAPGNYSVIITDNVGCTASAIANINAFTIPLPICLVTVDTSTSTKNVVVWEKPVAANIDSFRIYRNISSVLTHIASVPYDSLSMYTDTSSGINPKIQAYEYAISVIDTCGNESAKSTSHITIHQATPQFTPPNTFDLSWTDYSGFTFSQYIILRDNNNNGIWVKIDSVPYTLANQYTDFGGTHPIPSDSARYIVEASPALPCIATIKNPIAFASTIKSSKSNTSDKTQNPNSVNENIGHHSFSVYPNPNHGSFTLETKSSCIIKIYNTWGELVYQSTASGKKTEIRIPEIAKGVYQLQVTTAEGIANRKIIIN